MEKMLKKIKIFIVILLVILISIIAFWGIFKKENGVWKNLVADYKYGMDIEGARELRYIVDDSEEEKYVYVDENGNVMGEVWKDGSAVTSEEENSSEEGQATEESTETEVPYAKETRTIKVNEDDKLTKENFETSKKVIQERLQNQEVSEYNIRIDDVTGALSVETKNDNDNIDLVEELISQKGKFEIIDYQNGLVLMDNSDIKNVSVVSSNNSGYNTYLQIEFDKEGAQKLKDISNKYVEIAKESTDETETEEYAHEEGEEDTNEESEETTKLYVSVVFDDTTMMTTYFGEEMTAGILQISVGKQREEYEEFLEDYESAQKIANVLNSGVLPVTYELETDNFVKSQITVDMMKNAIAVGIIAVAIVSVIFIVKFKKDGLLASILGIGYIAILSIVVRYTNVTITVNSLIAYIGMIVMNYVFMMMFIRKMKDKEISKAYNEIMKEFYLKSIPVCVIAIVFTLFTNSLFINSIGTVVFWGVILNALYNFIFTKTVLKK